MASYVLASGIKSAGRTKRQYEHPIVVVGAGLGGMQCMMDLQQNGRRDLILLSFLIVGMIIVTKVMLISMMLIIMMLPLVLVCPFLRFGNGFGATSVASTT